jgi:succinyl-CoA synthetase beta subunit
VLLFEFEGKRFLREYGVSIPRGALVESLHEVPMALRETGAPAMVKAQILTGGRGKAGGVLAAETADDVSPLVRSLLEAELKGRRVERVLIEERLPLKAEYYAALLVDGGEILALLGLHGGMDVESFFAQESSSIEVVRIDPLYGLQGYQTRAALECLGVRPELWPGFTEILARLLTALRSLDATLVEVNPLGETEDGRLVALDARIEVDDGALFRQPTLREIQGRRPPASSLERMMRALEIQYLPMGGNVGLLSSGAGAGVTILDWISLEGERPSGFMDIDYAILSGKTGEAIRLALNLFANDPAVRSIVVNFTSCGVQVDRIARTLVEVLREAGARLAQPYFIHIQGNRAAEAHRVIRAAGYRLCETLGEAVRGACQAARDARRP